MEKRATRAPLTSRAFMSTELKHVLPWTVIVSPEPTLVGLIAVSRIAPALSK